MINIKFLMKDFRLNVGGVRSHRPHHQQGLLQLCSAGTALSGSQVPYFWPEPEFLADAGPGFPEGRGSGSHWRRNSLQK